MSVDDLASEADVELRLPADGAFAYVLRTTAAALAARVDFTLDDIEDLRIAVSEATALLLEGLDSPADLRVGFQLTAGRLEISLSVPSSGPDRVDREGFAWQVLTALANDTEFSHENDRALLRFTLSSSVPSVGTV